LPVAVGEGIVREDPVDSIFLAKYWAEIHEPEPLRTEHSKQRALASAPPADTYLAADQGEVEEYFAPGRYARYERSVTFEPPPGGGGCLLQMIQHTKVQIAEGTRAIDAHTDNGKTTVTERPLRPIPPLSDRTIELAEKAAAAASPPLNGLQPGDYSKTGQNTIAGEDCELIVNTAPIIGMTQVLHWTETASEFHVNESFSDQIFTPPPRSK
jgi:hypothetical protein